MLEDIPATLLFCHNTMSDKVHLKMRKVAGYVAVPMNTLVSIKEPMSPSSHEACQPIMLVAAPPASVR